MTQHSIDDVIRARKTTKVLGDVDAPLPPQTEFAEVLQELIDVAGHAPFHKVAAEHHQSGDLDSPVPWRFYVLDAEGCRSLLAWLKTQDDKLMRGKMPRLLATAGALIQVTWLPDDDDFSSLNNQEHLMAAACATQNLLLAATARGIDNFWSSGASLRDPEVFEKLGIPAEEQLVGSILFFPEIPEDAKVGAGSHRGKNLPSEGWARKVKV